MVDNRPINQTDFLGLAGGVSWQPPPCEPVKLYDTDYVQRVVGGANPFQIDDDWPKLKDHFDRTSAESPAYFAGDKTSCRNDTFRDDPGGVNGDPEFELCRVCICKKTNKIVTIGPCVSRDQSDDAWPWSEAPTDLGADTYRERKRPTPSIAFMQQLTTEYGHALALDPRAMGMCGPSYPMRRRK